MSKCEHCWPVTGWPPHRVVPWGAQQGHTLPIDHVVDLQESSLQVFRVCEAALIAVLLFHSLFAEHLPSLVVIHLLVLITSLVLSWQSKFDSVLQKLTSTWKCQNVALFGNRVIVDVIS